MFMRLSIVLSMVVLLAGCPYLKETHPSVQPVPVLKKEQRRLNVAAFNRVKVEGPLNVNLHTGYKHSEIILEGDPRDLLAVTTTVMNGLLDVSIRSGYPKFGRVLVNIKGRYLNAFTYHGSGIITGNQLHARLLDLSINNKGVTKLQGQLGLHKLTLGGEGYIEIKGIHSSALLLSVSGKPKIKLVGMANLEYLKLKDNAWLSLYWIKSNTLTIRGHGKTVIQLAGIAKRLDVELWGSAQFKGRYLRADRAFVKTHDKSVAEISAVKRQHTLASDKSDILFYNIPTMKTDFMAYDGAVLDMRDLRPPRIQEYDEYNK